MYNGGEAADQMVSYAFKGGEVVLRLSGAAAKNLAVYLTALLKQGGPSKGKTTLKRMIADGKELTVQRIDTDQIPYFNAMAKKYGVMFVAVRDRKNGREFPVLAALVDNKLKELDYKLVLRIIGYLVIIIVKVHLEN